MSKKPYNHDAVTFMEALGIDRKEIMEFSDRILNGLTKLSGKRKSEKVEAVKML